MGQTLGFIAFGRVARAVAERAKPFGLRLMAFDPFLDEFAISAHGMQPDEPGRGAEPVGDFISMHLPATPRSGRLPQGAALPADEERTRSFINTGRGPTVKKSALIKALPGEDWIAGAGLDVFQQEAPAGDNPPPQDAANVICQPHNASASASSIQAAAAA